MHQAQERGRVDGAQAIERRVAELRTLEVELGRSGYGSGLGEVRLGAKRGHPSRHRQSQGEKAESGEPHLHLYGKAEAKEGRKMGHVTRVSNTGPIG